MIKFVTSVILGVLILSGCGGSDPPTFTRAEKWNVIAEGAAIEQRGGELLTLIPSSSVTGYQAEFAAGDDASRTLILRYDIKLQGGPGYIGVLSGDKKRWLNNVMLPVNESSTGEISVQTENKTVFVVLQTSAETTPGSVFTVNDVQVAFQ